MSKYLGSLGMLVLLFSSPVLAADAKEDLWAAAKKGDAKAVEALLAKGTDVNAKTEYGVTALHYAADKGHVEVVKVLLKHKANVNAKDTFYTATPLTWAQMRDRWEIVKLLVESGADGAVALLGPAAKAGQTEVVRAILDKGKAKGDALNTALAASSPKHPEIAELLKKAGAKEAPPKPEVQVPADVLKAYVGSYEASGQQIKLVLKDGKLCMEADGQILFTFKAVGPATFNAVGDESKALSVQRDGEKVTGFLWKGAAGEVKFKRVEATAATVPERKPEKPSVIEDDRKVTITTPLNWPSFRGPSASGVGDGQYPPLAWDVEQSKNIVWKTPIPGFAHACPVVWESNLFVTTAVSSDVKASLKTGQYGDVDSVNDTSVHTWRVYCLDKKTGKILWERMAHEGVPKVKRHMKGSHANPTPATDGKHVVACFGSEGLYCYDFQGQLLWKRDLGTLDSGWFYDADYQWGFGSSPIIYKNMVIVQCDVGKNSFIAAYDVETGSPIWQTPREEIPSWGTPAIIEAKDHVELVTNATKFVRGYDPATGKELWRLGKNAEITVPTPILGQGLIFVTSGYRPIQPIYAIRPGAKGDISLKEGKDSSDSIAWSKKRGGPYMPTPIIYGPHLYTLANNGLLTCYDAKTGERVYQERIPGKGGYTASPVAADGYLYLTSEDGEIRVVKAGKGHEVVATNKMNDICMATPAISEGMLFVRTQHFVYGIGRGTTGKPATAAHAEKK
jgi:outer membrane protein assembly factor BamB